jgi:DNA-binding beta-propeller fold protein YncE
VRAALGRDRRAVCRIARPVAACALSTRRFAGRGSIGRALVAICVLLVASLLASDSALAADQGHREHVLTSSFAVATGKGKPAEPSGIAVNDTTGDVYVIEGTHKVVDQFKPDGTGGMEFVRSFTKKVPNADAIAVDNSAGPSAGDVYVGTTGGKLLKFTSEGEAIELPKPHPGYEEILGVAVDASGDVFVSEGTGDIAHLDNAVTNALVSRIETGLVPGGSRPGLALDSAGNFYAGSKGVTSEPELTNLFTTILREVSELNPAGVSYAVIAKLEAGSGKLLIPAMDLETSPAVAVNDSTGPGGDVAERDDVYVVNVAGASDERSSTVAQFAGAESAPGQPGELIQRIALPPGTLGAGIAIDHATGALYVTDAASGTVDVLTLAPAAPPKVSSLSALASPATPDAWTLGAKIDARGADTHYHFEYGTGSCAQSACTQTPSTDIGESFGAQAVSAEVSGLSPGSVYHYRVVAESALGTATSAEGTFAIARALAGLPDGRSFELVSPPKKNGAEPEAITAEGGAIQAAESGGAISYVSNGPFAGEEPEGSQSPEFTQILSIRGPEGWSSKDISPPSTSSTGVITGEPLAVRAFSPNLSLSVVEPNRGIPGSGPEAHPPLSPQETKQKTLYLRADRPLAPEASGAESFEKAVENGTQNENAGYLAVVNDANAKETFSSPEFGGGLQEGLEFVDATPDLSHIVFRSETDSRGLYEWSGAHQPLRQVGLLPGGAPEPNAFLGLFAGRNTNHAISSDGSRVVWSSKNAPHLYVRDTVSQETVQLDAFHGTPEVGEPNAYFETASADGSKVFFTDTQRLTPDSHAVLEAPDLYVFESTPGTHPLTGTLRDLTPQAGAGIVVKAGGGVLGASEDGSYVYFVANGAIAPGATPGHCPLALQARPAGTTCNLYVRHFNGSAWEAAKLVATLSVEDAPDWGNLAEGNLRNQTSRVSPSGRYLAFMSNRNLTGYEPIDAVSGKRDEEVYLYDAQSASLSCASCNPSGAAPFGVEDLGATNTGESPEGIGLVVDRPLTWAASVHNSMADHSLAGSVPGWTPIALKDAPYQSRYLSDSGRLFFNSPDHLVPAATGEKEKVYEYQPSGVGSCSSDGGCVALISGGDSEHESAFLDASANGNDVFFLSAQALVPNPEANFSVYDAHVCEPASPCPAAKSGPPAACDEENVQCRPPTSPPGGSGPLATGNLGTPGNIVPGKTGVLPEKVVVKPTIKKPLTRAQKLAAALRTCRKLKNKAKRHSCEKAARKKYGPKKSAKKAAKK